jgi:hypothetical protein
MRNSDTPRDRRGSFGTKGFYVAYIERRIQRRADAGLPPAPDIADQAYWDERRRNEAEKNEPLNKRAA